MLFGLFGSRGANKDIVFDEFKSQIESNGMKVDSVDEEGLIYISQGELTLKINLDNVIKNYERDKDKIHILEFVQTLISYSTALPSKWVDVKDDVYISLFPNDFDFQDFLHFEVTDEFSKVYVHSGKEKFTWLTKEDLSKWMITENELENQVGINADKLLDDATITFDAIENRKLGRIEVEHASLKGALLFAPSMKRKAESDFGFPFYAVIPVRDFCYLFAEDDFDFFASRIGKVVVDEYVGSGYPITTEVLRFSDDGVEAVGKYPVGDL